MDINHTNLIFHLAALSQLPRLYFAFVLLFLIPFSCFIVLQLFRLIHAEASFYQLKKKDILLCTDNEVLCLLYIMLKKKLFFDAIKIIEVKQLYNDINLCQFMNALGFIYYNMHQYDLAKFYYIRALEIKNDYIAALQNIAKVYELTKENRLLKLTCDFILRHDPENKIARRYLAN